MNKLGGQHFNSIGKTIRLAQNQQHAVPFSLNLQNHQQSQHNHQQLKQNHAHQQPQQYQEEPHQSNERRL